MTTDATTQATIATIEAFNDAFNRHDMPAVMALMTEDVVFENTNPAPDGTRYEGAAAVRGYWEHLFGSTPQAHFTTEELFAAGDRCVVRWRFDWDDHGGHIRGVM